MYRVRFHLSKGKNFMNWQVKNMDTGEVQFYDPQLYTITMIGTKLKNRPKTAVKIYNGAHKEVCAWVECKEVRIACGGSPKSHGTQLRYNPRVTPHWTKKEKIVDDVEFDTIVTMGRDLFESGV